MINSGPAIHLRSDLSSGFHWIRFSGPGHVWARIDLLLANLWLCFLGLYKGEVVVVSAGIGH